MNVSEGNNQQQNNTEGYSVQSPIAANSYI